MLKIILTGPESSGKTTLTKHLGNYFNSPFTEEYARKYIRDLNRDYTKNDLLEIAKKQIQNEDYNAPLLFCDTDLITLKIWSEYKYGECDSFILNHIEKQKKQNRLYLLCKPDINWEFDPQRENAKNRKEIFIIYRKELHQENHVIIKGLNQQRTNMCIDIVKKYIKKS